MATMSDTMHTIEVDVPVRTAYDQWTQFEEFPRFMEGVEQVVQRGDDRVHFVVNVGGKRVEYDAEIFEQVPDKRIAWRSITGKDTGGVVTFESLGPNRCRVGMHMTYAREGVLEHIGDLLGLVGRRTQNDLKNFKEFIERRGHETGAWRGEIHK